MYYCRVKSERRRLWIGVESALAMILLLVGQIHAQDGGGGSSTPATHPFAFALGSGDSAAPETKVYDLRIPIYVPLIPMEDRPWGLRLKMTVFAGVYRFTVDEAIDLDLRFQSLAATPGVEFLIPAGKGWVLKPFTEIGYAYDFDDRLGFGVWSVGMRTIVTWPIGKIDLSFGTKVQYLSTFTSRLAAARPISASTSSAASTSTRSSNERREIPSKSNKRTNSASPSVRRQGRSCGFSDCRG